MGMLHVAGAPGAMYNVAEHVLDLAEIPTAQRSPAIDANGDGRSDGAQTVIDGLNRPHGLDLHDGWAERLRSMIRTTPTTHSDKPEVVAQLTRAVEAACRTLPEVTGQTVDEARQTVVVLGRHHDRRGNGARPGRRHAARAGAQPVAGPASAPAR